jgi:hypothetical protein
MLCAKQCGGVVRWHWPGAAAFGVKAASFDFSPRPISDSSLALLRTQNLQLGTPSVRFHGLHLPFNL